MVIDNLVNRGHPIERDIKDAFSMPLSISYLMAADPLDGQLYMKNASPLNSPVSTAPVIFSPLADH
jgi:hypothetical protein